MSIFVKKDNPEMRSLLAGRQKVPIFWRKILADQEIFLRKQEKAVYQRN
jgi:hypothetical protein